MENPFKKFISKDKIKKVTLGVVATGLSLGAMGSPTEKSNEGGKKKGDPVDGKPKVELATAIKVSKDKIPTDHKLYTIENGKKYYLKKVAGEELPQAKPGTAGKLDAKYHSWLIEKLNSGLATAEELAKKGYISADQIPIYKKYEKISLVYTEDEVTPEVKKTVEVNPYAGFGKMEEVTYYNNRVYGIFGYRVTQSTDIKDAGMKNTGNEDVIYQKTDENLKPIGAPVIILRETWDKIHNSRGGKYLDEISEKKLSEELNKHK